VSLIGCGGLGSNQAKMFVQMGFGQVDVVEPDRVEDSNRNRQLFKAEDVGLPKAHRVLNNIEPYAVYRTVLRGYFMTFQEWARLPSRTRYDAICCGVDCIPTMVAVSQYGFAQHVPVVFTNVSRDGEACQPCIPQPAISDILHVAVGFGARAAVGEILGLPISDTFNCRDITFGGFDIAKNIAKRVDCPLCGEARPPSAAKSSGSQKVITSRSPGIKRQRREISPGFKGPNRD